MKINIEIWQSDFNDQWYCDLFTDNEIDTKRWEADNLICLLQELNKILPTLMVSHKG